MARVLQKELGSKLTPNQQEQLLVVSLHAVRSNLFLNELRGVDFDILNPEFDAANRQFVYQFNLLRAKWNKAI